MMPHPAYCHTCSMLHWGDTPAKAQAKADNCCVTRHAATFREQAEVIRRVNNDPANEMIQAREAGR